MRAGGGVSGHRMVVVGFADERAGQLRFVERDLVGGLALRAEPLKGSGQQGPDLEVWSWRRGEEKWERLVNKDVSATAPGTGGSGSYT